MCLTPNTEEKESKAATPPLRPAPDSGNVHNERMYPLSLMIEWPSSSKKPGEEKYPGMVCVAIRWELGGVG